MKIALIFIIAALLGVGTPYAIKNFGGNLLGATTVLTVPQGGTGISTLTKGDILVATSTNRFYNFGIGSANQVLTVSNGLPLWSSSVTTTNFFSTNSVFISATTTNLNVSGITNLANTTITNATTTNLYVSGLSVLNGTSTFNNTIFASGTTGGTPGSGAGTRFMWIPSKAAVRFGYTTGAEWDNANIGYNSFAYGETAKASGADSSALGYYTTGAGARSFAAGSGSTANGADSTAVGQNNYTDALAPGATVVGRANSAYASACVAVGYQNLCEAAGATTIGSGGDNYGSYSTLIALNSLYAPAAKAPNLPNTLVVLGGNVDIGSLTFNPAVLSVSATSTSGPVQIIKGIDGFTGNYFDIQNSSGTSQLIVKGNGFVGLGTSTPDATFQVATSTANATTTATFGKSGTKGFCVNWYATDGTPYSVMLGPGGNFITSTAACTP